MDFASPELSPDFESVLDILQSIAGNFAVGSPEANAIKESAEAYLFLSMHLRLRKSYEAFREAGLKGLSNEQAQHLRDMGIDTDAD